MPHFERLAIIILLLYTRTEPKAMLKISLQRIRFCHLIVDCEFNLQFLNVTRKDYELKIVQTLCLVFTLFSLLRDI